MNVPPMPPRVRAEINSVCLEHGLTYQQLVRRVGPQGKSKAPRAEAVARWDAMTRMRSLRRPNGDIMLSLAQIGKYLGGKDHTTVLHGLKRWAQIQAPAE